MITQQQINDVVNKIVIGYNPDKIILFGSYSTGNATENSDLDLVIVKDSNEASYKCSFDIRKILRQCGIILPLDIIVMSNKELQYNKDRRFTLEYEINKNGKLLYGR